MARRASRTTFNFHEASPRGTRFEGRRGFTIVELLIVIVVIAILAAITIVAYNGIQGRAKASAAQAAAKQAFTKIQAFAVSNADTYPADLAAAGLTNSDGTSYQYRVDNGSNPRTFCVTATTQDVSYYVSNTTSAPTAGGCPGHGANGVAAITNLVRNPSFEEGTSTWYTEPNVTPGLSGASATAGGQALHLQKTASGAAGNSLWTEVQLVAGSSYTLSVDVRNVVGTGNYQVELRESGGATVATTGYAPQPTALTRITLGGTVTTSGGGRLYLRAGTGSTGDTVSYDAVLLVQNSSANKFGDGNSRGWIWNGTPNNSTSTGPPL